MGRIARFGVALALGGVMAVVASGCGSAAPVPYSFAHKTAVQIARAAFAAAKTKPSFHYVSSGAGISSGTTFTLTMTGDVTRDEGVQQITGTAAAHSYKETVELIGGTVYLRGDQPALQYYNAITPTKAAQYANQWIEVPASSTAFATFAAGLTTASVLSAFNLSAPLRVSKMLRQGALAAVLIGGQIGPSYASSAGLPIGTSGSLSLLIVATKQPLPEKVTDTEQFASGHSSGSTTLSRWGEKVVLEPPTKYVASSLIFGS
ncbi:MAG: hypothetical protein ACYCZN_01650 [Candidatus Dormibacteria bacterium]